jgi:hypothetical protein
MSRSKSYFITNNHGQSEEEIDSARAVFEFKYNELIEEGKVSYIIWCREEGTKTGRAHEHLYVRFKNARSFDAIQKRFTGSNIAKAKGTDKQCAEYLKKEGEYEEFGTLSSQGRRTDLEGAITTLKEGGTIEQIINDEPFIFHTYGRTLERVANMCNAKKYRTKFTKGRWYYGGTGTGKSHAAFLGYMPETHYVKNMEDGDVKWWDGYTGQKTVIIDEFRGEIGLAFLLRLMDKWPLTVARRGNQAIPFTSDEVIVTSCYHPHHIYKTETNKQMKQLYRRCEVIHMHNWDGGCSALIENINRPIRYLSSLIKIYFSILT